MLKNLKFKIFFQTQILKIYLLLILNIFNILRIRFQNQSKSKIEKLCFRLFRFLAIHN